MERVRQIIVTVLIETNKRDTRIAVSLQPNESIEDLLARAKACIEEELEE